MVHQNHTKIEKLVTRYYIDHHILICKNMINYLPSKNYSVIPNFIIKPPREVNLKTKIKQIGFIGRLEARKGCYQMLIQMSNCLKNENLHLNIYGEGEEYYPIKEYVFKNKLNNYVTLHGWIDDISYCYINNDIIVIPSHYEPFGIVILESFYYNCACIISDKVLINNEIVKNKINSLTYDVNKNYMLVERILELVNCKELFNNIQKEAFNTYKEIINLNKIKNTINNLPYKNIHTEFERFKSRFEKNQPFSLVRYGDGEFHTLKNANFNCQNWQIKNNDKSKLKFNEDLASALQPNNSSYFIGIPCGCNESRDNFRQFFFSTYDYKIEQLTFATIFNNAMYPRFQNEILPIIKEYSVVLISNENTNFERFLSYGFNVKQWVQIPTFNAWKKTEHIYEEIEQFIEREKPTNHIFLFSAGPVSKIIIHRLHTKYADLQNFYLDMGSTLDPYYGFKPSRNYHQWFSWKILSTCHWEHKSYPGQISCNSQDYNKLQRCILKLLGFLWKCYLLLINDWYILY